MRNTHKYEELFPDEFKAELQRSPIIYCSFSPVEYHHQHGVLGMDLIKGYEICLRAAAISGGIVYPMLPVAPSLPNGPDGKYFSTRLADRNDIRKMASIDWPTVYISGEVCKKLILELLEVFAEDVGFKVCVLMGSHGPAGILAKKIAAENPSVKGMKVIAAGSLTHNLDVVKAEYARLGIARINHGGMWESAMLMASNPELVNPEKLKTIPPGVYEKWSDEIYGPHVRPDYEEMSKVSVEFGVRLVQTAAERIAQEALQALKEMGSDNQNE